MAENSGISWTDHTFNPFECGGVLVPGFPAYAVTPDGKVWTRYDLCKHVDAHAFDEESNVFRVGVKQAGRMLDGVLHDAFPEVQHAS